MEEFDQLVEIVRRLRGPSGCPWDRQQNHRSLKRYLLEEAYEALEAIDQGAWERLAEELGDVLLQVVLHAQLAAEQGLFDIREVLRRVNAKLIRRHPHVFGDLEVRDADEVLRNWERIKRAEPENSERASVLDGVPRSLPALQRAEDVQRRAARVGFDWPEESGVWEKVGEELEELRQAAAARNQQQIEAEFGDLLFSLVNLARFLAVEPEEALRGAIERFTQRFRTLENRARQEGRELQGMSLAELDELWEAAKHAEGQDRA
jgi:tetrapyrrole methylase family protein/MazG family protein